MYNAPNKVSLSLSRRIPLVSTQKSLSKGPDAQNGYAAVTRARAVGRVTCHGSPASPRLVLAERQPVGPNETGAKNTLCRSDDGLVY